MWLWGVAGFGFWGRVCGWGLGGLGVWVIVAGPFGAKDAFSKGFLLGKGCVTKDLSSWDADTVFGEVDELRQEAVIKNVRASSRGSILSSDAGERFGNDRRRTPGHGVPPREFDASVNFGKWRENHVLEGRIE